MKQKLTVLLIVCAIAAGPMFANAQSSSTDSALSQIQSLLQTIRELQDQLNQLQEQQRSLQADLREAVQLSRSLFRGLSGDDVTELQELLASDPEIYPEGLVTGFFGPLTESAVRRFQARFGIDQVGVVGPITRGMINRIFGELNKGKGSLNRGHGNIFDRLELNEDDDDVDLSEFVPGTRGILVCHIPRGNPSNEKTIAIGGPAVRAHLAHGDTLGRCDGDEDDMDDEDEMDEDEDNDEDDDQDEEDTTAPEISNISLDVSTSTVVVRWETDEDADSTVWYGTSTPLDLDTADSESDSSNVTDHEITLEDLTPATDYYIVVGSEDESGNLATSSERLLVTDSE